MGTRSSAAAARAGWGRFLFRNDHVRAIGTKIFGRFVFSAGAQAESELLAVLPEQLDHIDGLVEGGVLNGEQLYAADFMIAPSLALLTYVKDLRPGDRAPSGDPAGEQDPAPAATA